MSDEELDRLERLADGATPGPWDDRHRGCLRIPIIAPHPARDADWRLIADVRSAGREREANAAFIAAARTAVPELIAEVRRLRAQIEGHCERIAKQNELLSKRAERLTPPAAAPESPQ